MLVAGLVGGDLVCWGVWRSGFVVSVFVRFVRASSNTSRARACATSDCGVTAVVAIILLPPRLFFLAQLGRFSLVLFALLCGGSFFLLALLNFSLTVLVTLFCDGSVFLGLLLGLLLAFFVSLVRLDEYKLAEFQDVRVKLND